MIEEELIKLTNALYKVTGLFPGQEPLRFAVRKQALEVLSFYISANKYKARRQEFLEKGVVNISLLMDYFGIAKEQNWLDNRNFAVLEKEYTGVKNFFKSEIAKIKSDKKEAAAETAVKIAKPKHAKPEEKIIPEKNEKEIIIGEAGNNGVSPMLQEIVISESKENENETVAVAKDFNADIDYENLTNIQLRVLELLQNKGQLKPQEISKHFPDVTSRSIRRELQGLKERNIINAIGLGRAVSYKINQIF
ncbi:MAG: hypothetical protein PHG23_00670 [Candidatus Pacebacteria bacterium]|nr:hypothetical protein [Candidatus Paceibacterota bacterium]